MFAMIADLLLLAPVHELKKQSVQLRLVGIVQLVKISTLIMQTQFLRTTATQHGAKRKTTRF